MTTIINPSGSSDNGAGWAVAVIVLIAVIVGGAYLWTHYRSTKSGADIHVILPSSNPSN